MSTCTPEDALSPGEKVGFTPDGALPSTMTITSISPTELIKGANGTSVTFQWGGPDLTGYFLDGESVQVAGAGTDWHVVIHGTVFFAAHYASYFGSSGQFGPLPFGGPTLDLTKQCQEGTSVYSSLVASLGAGSLRLPSPATRRARSERSRSTTGQSTTGHPSATLASRN